MITIAGSGPSVNLVDHVDVSTKKRSVACNYVFCAFPWQYHRWSCKDQKPCMMFRKRGMGDCDKCKTAEVYQCDEQRWISYYKQFVRTNRPPQRVKPSLGLCAVFGVVERWNPDTIGLIGFDKILDADETWEHDAIAELACMRSLVNIKDLRDDTYLRRVRP